MPVFLVWVGLTGLVLTLYSLFLWKRNKKKSQFQAKLTILFLLFILIPTIPLTLFVANLLTQSADMLLLPGVGNALETSLDTIRSQVEEKGKTFFLTNPDPGRWTVAVLMEKEILFAGHFKIVRDSMVTVRLIRHPDCPLSKTWLPGSDLFKDANDSSHASYLIPTNREQMISVCKKYSESSLAVVCYPVPASVSKAKDEITKALNVYNTLSLLKESIIQKNIIWAIASLLIVALALLAMTAAKKLSQGISEPIQDLVQGMHRVASGDFSKEVHTRAKGEIRFLVESFNKMMQELQTTRQKLFQAEKLAAWQEAARRISHEIRNSLTPIFISLRRIKTMQQNTAFSKQITENLDTIQEELVSLESMSAEFSEFARMPQPQKIKLNLNDSIQTAIRIAGNAAGTIQINMELPENPLFLKADREQLKRMFHNLIKNAIEASYENGTVTIRMTSAEKPAKTATIEIEDYGEGMDQSTLDKLFQPYFTTKKKGTGLGLVIAKKIAEDHGGAISVESQKKKGTIIRITFNLNF